MGNALKGIAFIGGFGPPRGVLREIACGADVLVAADSGLHLCEGAGLTPDWVLGDMDSLDDVKRLEKYPGERVIRLPAEKDVTDTEFAVSFLRGKGCSEIWLSGGGGGRLDHLFAIRAIFERADPPARWYTGNEIVHCLEEGRSLCTEQGSQSIVSVFPLGEGPWEAESLNLKWPLEGLVWERGSAWISNVAFSGRFEIRAVKGRIMVVLPVVLEEDIMDNK